LRTKRHSVLAADLTPADAFACLPQRTFSFNSVSAVPWQNFAITVMFAAVREAGYGPGCVKSRTAAMILFLNRRSGATDVRLCGGD
jgi:hypothetical protein